jgi:hypothetical protein
MLAVEVDQSRRTGNMERVPALLRAMDGYFPAPWAFGIHNVWLQIAPSF